MPIQPNTILARLKTVIFLVSMPFFILGLMLPVYGREIGASVVEIGLFYSAFSLMTVLMRPLVGWGLDRLGRRGFFLAGLAGYAVTMFSFAFIDQSGGVIAARIFQGISSSLLWLSLNAVTADLAADQERAATFGKITQSGNRGAIMGTFVGFFLLNTDLNIPGLENRLASWMVLFLLYGVINLAALLLAARSLPETRPLPVAAMDHSSIRWSQTWILLLLVTFVTGASAALISPILIIFLQDKLNVGVETLSWAFLPSGLVWALLPARLGKLADRLGRKPMMLVGLVAAGISSFIIPAVGSALGLAVLWALQSACYAAGDPAEQALVADLTGRNQRGRAYGLYVMCADLGATIGPLGGAWLYQEFNASTPFNVNGIILLVCALVLLVFLKPVQANPVE